MKVQVWLVAYSHRGGMGRFFNRRTDGLPPSIKDIESMEKKLSDNRDIDPIIISVSQIADDDATDN
ncbi:hypothetical protein KS43_19575 [Pectobacterium odoriferum]|nr:hypothetical protein KS43_19575 [Pectobacterium odoriferum]